MAVFTDDGKRQRDASEPMVGCQWPGPPARGARQPTGGPRPPPRRRPAKRPARGPSEAPPKPAPEPSRLPAPGRQPVAVDLTTVAVIDLRLAEESAHELVGAPSRYATVETNGISTTRAWSSLLRLRGDDADDSASEGSRPISDPDDGGSHVDDDDGDRWRRGNKPRVARPVWPEIRFYIGAASLFFISFAIATGMWVLGPRVVMGWHSAAITSGSMEPVIQVGDVVVFSDTASEHIGPGTVIVFPNGQGSLVTHRVVGQLEDGRYITRGDNNAVNDSAPVPPEAIHGVGRLLVPYAGFPAVWMASGSWLSVALVAALFGGLSFASRWALLPSFSPWRRR